MDYESVIDHQLVPGFYAPRDVFTRFNMDEVLRGDFEVSAGSVNKLIQVGVLKHSEGHPIFGLAPVGPWADRLYGNAALVPLGSNASAPAAGTDGTVIPTPMQPVQAPAVAVPVRR